MPRNLLISGQDGRDPKTYGVKKVRIPNMKFSFIICVVTIWSWCGIAAGDTSILKDLQYLEYLNDLDRRNVELEDIHKQWPFHVVRPIIEKDEDVDREVYPEKLWKAVNMAKEEIANRKAQMYLDRQLENQLEEKMDQLKEIPDRTDALNQYRRYRPLDDRQTIEEARMYPERNEDEVSFHDDDETYQNSEPEIEDEDEEVTAIRPSLPRPFFPRIAVVEKPVNYENTFRDSGESDEEPEEEIMPNRKPSFPKSYFPRIAPVDFPVNFNIDDFNFGSDNEDNDKEVHNEHHHEHEDYKFKEGELFPHSISFDEVPVAVDPSEFAVAPNDPRFYRDAEQKENIVTSSPPKQETVHPYLLKNPFVSKPKMNSRSDLQKQLQSQSLPNNDDVMLDSSFNKDVEVVPFKPDAQADSAGVYIIAIIAGISAAATVGLIAVGIGWYNLQKHMKNAEDTDYPSYGIVGPNKDYEKKERDDAGDRRLAQSAQMYHYQHQKQQIIAMGRNPQGHGSQSDSEEEEDEEGNYTVYECPGLASIEGPLEVKNPMFDDDQLATPSQTPSTVTTNGDTK